MQVPAPGGQDYRIQRRVQIPVDLGQLELPVKIPAAAGALDQGRSPLLPGKVGQQALTGGGAGVGDVGHGGRGHLHAFLQGEHRFLAAVDHHAHDHLVEQGGRPLHQIQMAHRNGVKAAWADCNPHISRSSSLW